MSSTIMSTADHKNHVLILDSYDESLVTELAYGTRYIINLRSEIVFNLFMKQEFIDYIQLIYSWTFNNTA